MIDIELIIQIVKLFKKIGMNTYTLPEPLQTEVTNALNDMEYNWDANPVAYIGKMPYSINGRHSVRVICDEEGLTVAQKNIIAACIMQESKFFNRLPSGEVTSGKNYIDGKLSSTDWGIVQCNDYWHIGPKKDFPSVDYVVNNPDVMVRWMIQCLKEGKLYLWSSYGPKGNGPYKQWLNKV